MGASVSCTVRDYKGKSAIITVDVAGIPTLAKAKQLADYIVIHSDAQVINYGCSQSTTLTTDSCDAGDYDRVYQKLVYLFSDMNGKSKRFSLPAPRDEDVDVDQEGAKADATAIAVLLKNIGATTGALVFNGSGLVSKIPKQRKTS